MINDLVLFAAILFFYIPFMYALFMPFYFDDFRTRLAKGRVIYRRTFVGLWAVVEMFTPLLLLYCIVRMFATTPNPYNVRMTWLLYALLGIYSFSQAISLRWKRFVVAECVASLIDATVEDDYHYKLLVFLDDLEQWKIRFPQIIGSVAGWTLAVLLFPP